MAMTESPHRRRRRFSVSFPLKVWLPEDKKRASNQSPGGEEAETQNISTTGCYFHLSRAVPVGSKIELEIQMPPLEGMSTDGITLRCHGTVVRIESGSAAGA